MLSKDELFDLISGKAIYLSTSDLARVARCMGISPIRTSRKKLFNHLYGPIKYRQLLECLIKEAERLKRFVSFEKKEKIESFIDILRRNLKEGYGEIKTESDLIEKFLRSKNPEWYKREHFVGIKSLSEVYGIDPESFPRSKAGFLTNILPDTKAFRVDLVCKMGEDIWVLEAKKELKDFKALGQILVYSELYSKDTGLKVKKGIIIGKAETSMLRVLEEMCNKYDVKIFIHERDF